MRVFLFPIALFALAACAPLDIYYKPGVTVAKMERDTLRCETSALKDAPVANQTRQEPPRYIPPRKICNSVGTCLVEAGYYEPGRIYTVDVNADLRFRLERSCMIDKGYEPVAVRPCPSAIADATPPGATTRLPRLTQDSCVVRNRDGSWQIVNQG